MQIKSFSARTTKEILAQIKEELGPDAVILGTEEADGIITITAALESAPKAQETSDFDSSDSDDTTSSDRSYSLSDLSETSSFKEETTDTPVYSRPGRHSSGMNAGTRSVSPGVEQHGRGDAHGFGPPPPGWQQWHEEWNSIKSHLLALMKPAMRLDLLPPRQRLAIEFLQKEGVEDTSILTIFQQLQQDPAASILDPLSGMLPIRTWSEENWPQRIQIIAGPFGAGKTSVAIRLALSLRKTSPHCKICLVNADATRGNGRLLLRHYCNLSDMAYKEAASTLELVGALNEALKEGFERVIVDLPGLSRGRYLTTLLSDAGLAELTGNSPDALAVHLALPPHYGTLQLQGVLERYRTPHAGSIIWTKLDEAEHYGQLVNVAADTGLPVSALSYGPGLGNSLAPAKENMVWRLLFKRELPVGV